MQQKLYCAINITCLHYTVEHADPSISQSENYTAM